MLAAGRGERLRPLTDTRPKPLLTVHGVALLDLAIERLRPHVDAIAVNAHYLHEQIEKHLRGSDVFVSVEQPEPLGTAGALGALRKWIDGRDVLVTNGDAWYADPVPNLRGRDVPRLLVVPGERRRDYGEWMYAGSCYLPWSGVNDLEAVPTGLHEVWWRDAWARNRLEFVRYDGHYIDCGTPQDLAAANG